MPNLEDSTVTAKTTLWLLGALVVFSFGVGGGLVRWTSAYSVQQDTNHREEMEAINAAAANNIALIGQQNERLADLTRSLASLTASVAMNGTDINGAQDRMDRMSQAYGNRFGAIEDRAHAMDATIAGQIAQQAAVKDQLSGLTTQIAKLADKIDDLLGKP